ncbi:MAG TPA: NAD-dependent epimerase/dehydratase family protein [Chitinophagaceae bacterium]|jgi:nucleoside-diphosphate-sugar epimerase|nr:NAD-dependent epimerase/dehydratase family protein [Chitinophagaceae bacterium]
MALHTIIGANGTIATELFPILLENNEQVRLVSRNPKPVAGAQTIPADVLNYQQVLNAIQGSDVVYLLVGLEYNIKVWRASWPKLMRNVIDACKAANAKLIFFDNIYMYGKVEGKITEDTAFKPISKKGEVRAQVDTMLLEEMKAGHIKAAIAKATDFYGPRCTDKSAPGVLVFEKMKNKKTAQWFISANLPRAFSYTPDCAKGLYILATHEEAFGQVWHLPVAQPTPTGREFVATAARYMQAPNKTQVLPKWLLSVMGCFIPFMKEMNEMMYQYEFPLVLDSSKFEKAFNFRPTSYEEGIKATAEWFSSK